MPISLPDPSKLLHSWMEWERGESTPGRVMADLKTGGMRDLLEGLVRAVPAATSAAPGPADAGQAAPGQAAGQAAPGQAAGQAAEQAGPDAAANWSPIV